MFRRILIAMGLRSRTASEWGEMVRILAERNKQLREQAQADKLSIECLSDALDRALEAKDVAQRACSGYLGYIERLEAQLALAKKSGRQARIVALATREAVHAG